MSDLGVSFNEGQRRVLLTFVQMLAAMEVRAWIRDEEEVVTMSKEDADKLLAVFKHARLLAEQYSGLPF